MSKSSPATPAWPDPVGEATYARTSDVYRARPGAVGPGAAEAAGAHVVRTRPRARPAQRGAAAGGRPKAGGGAGGGRPPAAQAPGAGDPPTAGGGERGGARGRGWAGARP